MHVSEANAGGERLFALEAKSGVAGISNASDDVSDTIFAIDRHLDGLFLDGSVGTLGIAAVTLRDLLLHDTFMLCQNGLLAYRTNALGLAVFCLPAPLLAGVLQQ